MRFKPDESNIVTPGKAYITNIHLPKNPMITGMPAIISIDKINNCKVIVEKCAPYEVTIEKNHGNTGG